MKVFARTRIIHDEHCGVVPYNRNIALAIEGFHDMGFEIYLYHSVDEIYSIYQKGDIVLDGIDQVNYCLSKYNISPPNFEYPEPLVPYLGRKIWEDSINNINTHPELWGCFVKPMKEKAFTGKIINSPKDLIGCGNHSENYGVYCSEIVDFIFECRGLFYYDGLKDLRPYRGDWKNMSLLNTHIIDEAVNKYSNWEHKLNGCTLDWGLTKDGRTLFIEGNYGMCFGPYSTDALLYAKIISACNSQLSGTVDECKF